MMKPALHWSRLLCLIGCLFLAVGCDQLLPGPRHTKDAEQAEKEKNYPKAVRFYEASLDGTPATAEVHYRLAVIYDDKLKDAVSALHHYRRYLDLLPQGPKAKDAKRSAKRIEATLVVELGDGGPIARSEAVRLKNENMALHQQIAELKNPSAATAAAKAEKQSGKATRTYIVKKGDTLASISRKYYKSSARWKDIADANHNQLGGKVELKAGMSLIIPQ